MNVSNLLMEWGDNPAPIIATLAGVVVAAYLYWRGARYAVRSGIGKPVSPLEALAFASGLLVAFVAIASPLDALADHSFAAHMLQHMLLVFVAAPLLLLGQPLWRVWRAVPVKLRRDSLRWLLRRRRVRRVWNVIESAASRPVATAGIFLATFLLWHIPALYQLALRIEVIHAFEHVSFLGAALLFWAQVIPTFPLPSRLSYVQRAAYLFAASLVMHLAAVLIAIANRSLYSYYGVGASAVADQTAGGALMDVSGMIVFTVAILICLGLWLYADERAPDSEPGAVPVPVAHGETTASGALLLLEVGVPEAMAGPPGGESVSEKR